MQQFIFAAPHHFDTKRAHHTRTALEGRTLLGGIPKQLENQLKPEKKMSDLRNPSKSIDILVELQEAAIEMIVLKNKDYINYVARYFKCWIKKFFHP